MVANLSLCHTFSELNYTKNAEMTSRSLFAASDAPLSVDLLVLPETSLMSLAAVMEPMRGANRVAGRVVFRWRLWSVDGATPSSSSGLPIAVEGALGETDADALIAFSSFNVDEHGAAALPARRRAARRGVAGLVRPTGTVAAPRRPQSRRELKFHVT